MRGGNGRWRQVPRVFLVKITFGHVDERDHALVGFARGRTEREDAVVQQHHADSARLRLLGIELGAQPREIESRHYVRNDRDLGAVNCGYAARAVAGVRDREHRIGMRVIDVFVRQQRVQNRFDGWCRRRGARQVRDKLIHHLRIAQGLELRKPQQMGHAYRRKACFFDEFEVPAAAFDIENFLVIADEIALADFDRRIAAAVQHERLVAAQQTRGIDALRKIAAIFARFAVIPEALHRMRSRIFAGRQLTTRL